MSEEKKPRVPELLNPFDSEDSPYIHALLFGESATGKTGLASTAPRPLILDFEQGARITVRKVGNKDARIKLIEDLRDLKKTYRWLASMEHDHETVVLDPMGDLQKWLLEDALDRYPQKRAFGRVNTMQDWNLVTDDYKALLQLFMDLPMHLVLVAHAAERKHDDDPILPLLQGQQMRAYTVRRMDLVGYTFQELVEKKPVRKMQVEASATINAKNRGSYLPSVVTSPNLTHIFRVMQGEEEYEEA